MSLTNTTVPVLLCSFENSNVDSVSSISPSYSNNTAISYTTGKSGQSVFLNGTVAATNNAGPYLTYPVSLNSYPGFTVCLWIYPTSLISGASNTQVFMSLTDGIVTNGSYLQWMCDIGDPTKFHVYGQLPVAPNLNIYNGAYSTITASTWTHVAISYSGTSFTAYINGSAYTTLGSSVLFNPIWITLGSQNKGIYGPNILSGDFGPTQYDDLRVYNRPLNSTQIQQIYNAAGTPSAPISQAYTASFIRPSAGASSMTNVTSGSVLAYSYMYSTVNIQGVCVAVDAGSNVYFGGATTVFTSAVFPNSFQKVPDQFSSFFQSGGNNGAVLLKYNKLGKVTGMMKTSASNQTVYSVAVDAGSNVYVALSGIIGGSFNVYDLNPSIPNSNATSVNSATNIIKYSPSGQILAWGGGLTGSAGVIFQVSTDTGSNVYICGYYRNTGAASSIYSIASPPTAVATLPNTQTPAAFGYWPTIFKWSPSGTFLGYSIIRCQNGSTVNVIQNAIGQTLFPDGSGNMYWGGMFASNIYCNVNSISTTEPTSNSYSLNTTHAAATVVNTGSNAFVIQFSPSGTVNKFVEYGSSSGASGGRYSWVSGIGISSSGNVYTNGNFAPINSPTPLYNFGLADPKTGSYLSSTVNFSLAAIAATGSTLLVNYNSSGTVQNYSMHSNVSAYNAAPLVVDKFNNIYQFFTYTNTSFTLKNLGQTSSGLTVPQPFLNANYCIAKYNSSGNVIAFSVINMNNGNCPQQMAVDSTGVYVGCRFLNSTGVCNVNAMSTTVSLFANLPTITPQGMLMIKWAL
jgi:Concanavalin A-like lectin/glucanases superfamily